MDGKDITMTGVIFGIASIKNLHLDGTSERLSHGGQWGGVDEQARVAALFYVTPFKL